MAKRKKSTKKTAVQNAAEPKHIPAAANRIEALQPCIDAVQNAIDTCRTFAKNSPDLGRRPHMAAKDMQKIVKRLK